MTLLFQFLKRVQFCAYLIKGAERDLEQATQERLLALSGVEKSRKAAVAHDEIMDILATGDAALSRFEPPQEGFHLVVGAWQTWDVVAGKEAPPAIAESLVDVSRSLPIKFVVSRLDTSDQLDEILIDPAGHLPTIHRWGGRIEDAIQIDEPLSLAYEPISLLSEGEPLVSNPQEAF